MLITSSLQTPSSTTPSPVSARLSAVTATTAISCQQRWFLAVAPLHPPLLQGLLFIEETGQCHLLLPPHSGIMLGDSQQDNESSIPFISIFTRRAVELPENKGGRVPDLISSCAPCWGEGGILGSDRSFPTLWLTFDEQ